MANFPKSNCNFKILIICHKMNETFFAIHLKFYLKESQKPIRLHWRQFGTWLFKVGSLHSSKPLLHTEGSLSINMNWELIRSLRQYSPNRCLWLSTISGGCSVNRSERIKLFMDAGSCICPPHHPPHICFYSHYPHWERVVHLDVENCSEELLHQLSYAIKNQFGHPKLPTRELVLYGIRLLA